jgi:hypothetical protein
MDWFLKGPSKTNSGTGWGTKSEEGHPASFEGEVLCIWLGGDVCGRSLRQGKSHRLMEREGVAPETCGQCGWGKQKPRDDRLATGRDRQGFTES